MLPDDVFEKLFINNKSILFSTENEERRANALYISHEDFKEYKSLIHFNYHIWKYSEKKIFEIIFHEIAHAYLDHKSSVGQSNMENDKNECEADKLANKWIQSYKDK